MANSALSTLPLQNEVAAFAYVEAALWPDGPTCPFCGATEEHVGKLNGKTTRAGLHKCYACRKQFTVRIGTIFEDSHLPLHLWLQIIHLMCASKKGIATRQIQRMLKCSMKTAWHLSHRIREMMTETNPGALGGGNQVIEADETFVGGKAKNRAFAKPLPKKAVFSLIQRGGRVRSFHVPDVTGKTLRPIIQKHANRASYLMTDEAPVYRGIGRKDFDGRHGTVNHSIDEYVRGTFWHTNSIEGFFSILKRGVYGTYQHVSEAHLHRYLAEFDFRHNEREGLGIDDVSRANIALKGAKGKRLTYRTIGGEA